MPIGVRFCVHFLPSTLSPLINSSLSTHNTNRTAPKTTALIDSHSSVRQQEVHTRRATEKNPLLPDRRRFAHSYRLCNLASSSSKTNAPEHLTSKKEEIVRNFPSLVKTASERQRRQRAQSESTKCARCDVSPPPTPLSFFFDNQTRHTNIQKITLRCSRMKRITSLLLVLPTAHNHTTPKAAFFADSSQHPALLRSSSNPKTPFHQLFFSVEIPRLVPIPSQSSLCGHCNRRP